MKVFVAGATGALGQYLLPQLVANGHEVVGMTSKPEKQDLVRSLGARPVVADALDPEAVAHVIAEAEPDVIVHQLTALSGLQDLRHFERDFAPTNRLRSEGTDHLLAAGRAVGVKRFVAQSFAGWPSARTGGPVKTEDDPLDPTPADAMRTSHDAIRHLEEAVTGADWTEGIALRYGGFYGPGTSFSVKPEGELVELIRQAQVPDRRRRRRRVVVRPHRGRGDGNGGRCRARRRAASTTSSTTSPRRCANGCRRPPRRSAPASRCDCRAGSGGSRRARPRWS